jgi:hypothetical protein
MACYMLSQCLLLCIVTLHWRCCASSSSNAVSLHVDKSAALSQHTHTNLATIQLEALARDRRFFSNAFASEEIDEKNGLAVARLVSKNRCIALARCGAAATADRRAWGVTLATMVQVSAGWLKKEKK